MVDQVTEYWRLFLRRFWLIALVSTVGIVLSAFYAYIKPPVYQAKTKILVESQQIRNDLAQSTVTATAAERLQLIQQRLMSRNNLQNVIDELDLFANRDDLTSGEQIDALRTATLIQPDHAGRHHRNRDSSISAFTISVTFDDPSETAKIANRFATMVLDQNLKTRETQATETLKYFTDEVARVSEELRALEEQITAYKEANKDALPESMVYRQTELAQLNLSKQELERSLVAFEDQRGALVLALQSPPEQDTPEKAQLRQLEAELAQKSAVLSAQHRDIRALRTQISSLKSAIDQASQTAAEEYRQAEIKRQLDGISDEIALVQKQKKELDARRMELQDSLRRTPSVEIELNSLERKYNERQEMLSVNIRKQLEAETGAQLERNRQAENFELIEEARKPTFPIAPNRKKIAIMGSGLSVILALGLALLLDVMRPRIRSAAQMERVLDLTPVISVPYLRTRSERRFRMLKIASIVVICGVGIPTSLYQIDQKVMPLQLVAEKVASKSGLDKIIRWTERRF